MLENPMVLAQEKAERFEERQDRARARCFEMHVAEMLAALRGPAHESISSGPGRVTLWTYVAELFAEDSNALALLRVLRESGSVPLLIAERYAEQQTEFHAQTGALDV